MKKHFSTIILTAALSASTLSCFAQKQPESETGLSAMVPDKEQLDKRMQWFDNARFGMFIHWGVYSPLACSWNGKRYNGYGEHIQRMARIPVEVYKKEVVAGFNPEEFDAEEWIRIATKKNICSYR